MSYKQQLYVLTLLVQTAASDVNRLEAINTTATIESQLKTVKGSSINTFSTNFEFINKNTESQHSGRNNFFNFMNSDLTGDNGTTKVGGEEKHAPFSFKATNVGSIFGMTEPNTKSDKGGTLGLKSTFNLFDTSSNDEGLGNIFGNFNGGESKKNGANNLQSSGFKFKF